jgi:hypothetical protein
MEILIDTVGGKLAYWGRINYLYDGDAKFIINNVIEILKGAISNVWVWRQPL